MCHDSPFVLQFDVAEREREREREREGDECFKRAVEQLSGKIGGGAESRSAVVADGESEGAFVVDGSDGRGDERS